MFWLVICLLKLILQAEAMDTGAVILTANSHNMTYVTTNLSINYVGEANYTYEDGEDIYFSCAKNQYSIYYYSETLRLEYYNVEGTLLFHTKLRVTQHIFRSVFNSKNNKYYLDCVRTARDPKREYRYRTTFYMKKRNLHADSVQHAMMLYVNGQKLTVTSNFEPYYDDYIFRYIDGELLNVTCRKTDSNMRGTPTFDFDYKAMAPYIWSVDKSQSEGYISLNVSVSYMKKLTFVLKNSDVQKLNARVFFLSDVPVNDVRIRGLPRNNILYQYTNSLYLWTIEYQYSVNDILNLTCVSKGSIIVENQRFQWEFNDEISISEALLSYTATVDAYKTFVRILDATHNGKKIRCVYIPNSRPNRTVEIILRLKPEAGSGKILSDVAISAKQEKDDMSSSLVLGSSIGAVLVILGVTSVACWYVRTKNARRKIEALFANVTHHNNSATPQYTNEYSNQYDEASHYSENISYERY